MRLHRNLRPPPTPGKREFHCAPGSGRAGLAVARRYRALLQTRTFRPPFRRKAVQYQRGSAGTQTTVSSRTVAGVPSRSDAHKDRENSRSRPIPPERKARQTRPGYGHRSVEVQEVGSPVATGSRSVCIYSFLQRVTTDHAQYVLLCGKSPLTILRFPL